MQQTIVNNPVCIQKNPNPEYSNALVQITLASPSIPKNPRETFQSRVPHRANSVSQVLYLMKMRTVACLKAKLPVPTEFSFTEFTPEEVDEILEYAENHPEFEDKGIIAYREPLRVQVNGRWQLYNNRLVIREIEE